MNTQPFTKSQIFSLLWMAIVVAYLFAGPRGYGHAPLPLALLIVGTTIYSLVVLGRRFPMFGFFLICLISGLVNGRGGYYAPLYWYRRRRWW